MDEAEARIHKDLERHTEKFREVGIKATGEIRDLSRHTAGAAVAVLSILGPVLLATEAVAYPNLLLIALVGYAVAMVAGFFAVRRSLASDLRGIRWYLENVQAAQKVAVAHYQKWKWNATEEAGNAFEEAVRDLAAKEKQWYERGSSAGDVWHNVTWWTFVGATAVLIASLLPWSRLPDALDTIVTAVWQWTRR